jgi:hypothetical protein
MDEQLHDFSTLVLSETKSSKVGPQDMAFEGRLFHILLLLEAWSYCSP